MTLQSNTNGQRGLSGGPDSCVSEARDEFFPDVLARTIDCIIQFILSDTALTKTLTHRGENFIEGQIGGIDQGLNIAFGCGSKGTSFFGGRLESASRRV